MIEFGCTHCGRQLKGTDEAAGKRAKCPECGATLVVPGPELVTLKVADALQPAPLSAPNGSACSSDANSELPASTDRKQKHRQWVVLLFGGALMASLFAPKFPLWLGIILLVLCVMAFVPRVQRISRYLLRLDPQKKWLYGFRATMYGLIGLVLIVAGGTGASYKSEQQRFAAKQAEQDAEQQRLQNEANAQVIALVGEAKAAWLAGKSALANEKLLSAEKIPHATDLAPIHQLRARIANAEVEALMMAAKRAVRSGDIETASKNVQAALAVPLADRLSEARKLGEQISNATDPNCVRTTLMGLTDAAFEQLQKDGKMPAVLVSGYESLDSRAAELVKVQLAEVVAARVQQREEQLERERRAMEAARKAEEERKAQELAATEATRKAEAERRAQEQAKKEAAQKESKARLDAYVALLNAADVTLIENVSVLPIGDSIWEATLTVENLWHIRHYQVRLQDAQSLWEAWAAIASPREPDNARINIVDQRGNQVGGSRMWGGSLIWVKED